MHAQRIVLIFQAANPPLFRVHAHSSLGCNTPVISGLDAADEEPRRLESPYALARSTTFSTALRVTDNLY
jgi:hypothetical protein